MRTRCEARKSLERRGPARFRRARRQRTQSRRGATLIEAALTMIVFLALVLGMLDLGIAVFRQQVLAQATRELAREAIVHGDLADRLGTWGPGDYAGLASDAHPIADSVRAFFEGDGTGTPMISPAEVNIQVVWPSGSNEVEEPVRVILSTTYPLITTSLIPFTDPSIDLTASSEMPIAH